MRAASEAPHNGRANKNRGRIPRSQLSYMKELGMGNDLYTIIDIDNNDAEITVEDITRGIKPVWTPDRFNTFAGRNKPAR